MKTKSYNLDELENIVKSEIDLIVRSVNEQNISISQYLNDLYDGDGDVVFQLMLRAGLFEHNGMKAFAKDRKKYMFVLLSSYLDSIYNKCFNGGKGIVGLNNICGTEWISGLDYRPIENNFTDINETDNIMNIHEGHIVPVVDIKRGHQYIPLKKIALGMRWNETIPYEDSFSIYKLIEIVKDIGKSHHKLMFHEAMLMLLDGIEPIEFDGSIDENIVIKGVHGINLYEYLRMNLKAYDKFEPDTIIGGVVPTTRFAVSKSYAKGLYESIDNSIVNLYDWEYNIGALYGSFDGLTDGDNNMKRFMIYEKNKSLVWIRARTQEIMDNFEQFTHILFTNYFSNLYGFYMKQDNSRLLVELNNNSVSSDLMSKWKGAIHAVLM